MTRRSTVQSSRAPKAPDDQDGEREGYPVAEVVPDHEHVADEGAEHEEVALREVDELGGLVDEDEAEGDQAVDAPDGHPVQDQLQNDVQKRPPWRPGPGSLPPGAPSGVTRSLGYTGIAPARQSSSPRARGAPQRGRPPPRCDAVSRAAPSTAIRAAFPAGGASATSGATSVGSRPAMMCLRLTRPLSPPLRPRASARGRDRRAGVRRVAREARGRARPARRWDSSA